MNFDAFLEEATRQVKKKQIKKTSSKKKIEDALESIIFYDECVGIPQTEHGRKTYNE